jgi:hypothetical protein
MFLYTICWKSFLKKKKVFKPILVFSSTIVVERNSVQASFLNFFKKTNLFTQFNFILQNWSSFPRICNAQLIHSFSQWYTVQTIEKKFTIKFFRVLL